MANRMSTLFFNGNRVLILFLFILFLAGLSGCTPNGREKPGFDWLIGKWVMETPEGKFIEQWKKTSDSLFLGESVFLTGTDTAFYEQIRLFEKDGRFVYQVTVKGQNQSDPVDFPLVGFPDPFIFENLNHDFPQRIIYRDSLGTWLLASIEGMRGGEPARELFVMKRLSDEP